MRAEDAVGTPSRKNPAAELRSKLILPAICAPMFLVTTTSLMIEACKAGLMAGFPRRNAVSREDFNEAMGAVHRALEEYQAVNPGHPIGPIAVNFDTRLSADELNAELDVCRRHGIAIIITAGGDPAPVVERVHCWGGKVFHDVTNLRFAEKAIAAGVDGLVAIGSGGGGQSGAISHLVLVPRLRAMFDGIIVMAGGVANGAAIRAAEILGADLAYLGTRFIATRESGAPDDYKHMLLSGSPEDLIYTDSINGIPANWVKASIRANGLDPDRLPMRAAGQRRGHLPADVKPWKTLWSAGQGIGLIDDIPTVAALVLRLRQEYAAACLRPGMADAAVPSADDLTFRNSK